MDFLAKIDWQPLLEGGDGPPLLVFIAMGIVIITVVVAVQWRRVRTTRRIPQDSTPTYKTDQYSQSLLVRL
jgi:hypothetical protein